jgi:hypothetical protein
MGTMLVVCAFAPEPTIAQGKSPLVPVIGTTVKYEGWERGPGCPAQWVPYEQYGKIAGRVILPETRSNVFYLLETWGRDSGMMVVRFAPNGDLIQYGQGLEGRTLIRGPVGTYSEITDPNDGNTYRYEIAEDGIMLEVGARTYSNVSRLELYCTTCGPAWVRQQRFFLSPEVLVPIKIIWFNAQFGCWSRVSELVSVTTK